MPLPPRRRLTSVKPRPLRKLALDVLHEWNRGEDFAVALIDEAARDLKLAPRDTALLQTLIYGVLRNMSLLDHWAGLLTGNKILDRDTLNAVRLGLVQLLVLDMAPHAAVNETVEHAGRAGALVNAVLRRALREKEQLLAARDAAPVHIRCSHPEWLVQRWIAQFGEAGATALCEWNQQPAPLYVRVNQLRPKPAPFDFIKDEGNGFFLVEQLPTAAIESGSCYVQDPSTAIAPGLLAPTPSLSVLDMCAAPGGKSALLAQMMRNDGRIIATDSSGKRVQRMIANLERLGVNNVTSVVHDWVARPKGPIENKKFDRILIDVPCSNTGVMRRRVDVRWRLQEANVTALAETQAALLKCALQLLKPGGVVVYSTCSIEKAENQDVVQQALDSDSRVKLVETQQSLPHRDGIDGAYAAALQCA
jgi:16S rRNA (cytosine967-C5)-methyltransferase